MNIGCSVQQVAKTHKVASSDDKPIVEVYDVLTMFCQNQRLSRNKVSNVMFVMFGKTLAALVSCLTH